ncbi:MAG: hypothetical protein ACTS2F_07430 [Thainema sp.]
MYRIQVSGLGFIHARWKDIEPRFCADPTKAKSWTTLEGTLKFANQRLVPRSQIRWEIWQEQDGDLVPILQPQRAHR